MRLLKLLAYSLLGYVLYELYLGITEGVESESSDQSREKRWESTRRDAGATTGGSTGGGRSVRVEDAGGAQATRNVGRGAVH